MSQMNQGPGVGQHGANRPGQMTAVMRAMQQATGPKVLRIGLVASGRILEEWQVRRRLKLEILGEFEPSTYLPARPP